MIDAIFNQPSYQAARAMMDVSAIRHEAISSNLGNVESPGYKRIDVSKSFEESLNRALETKDTQQLQALRPTLEVDPSATATGPDGNSVVLEDEMLRMSENTLAYQFHTQAVTSALLKVRMAITGRAA